MKQLYIDKLIANILPFVIVTLIAAFVGLTIVKIVDYRLSDISINMPAITLPTQQITIKMNGVDSNIDSPSLVYSPTGQTGGSTTDENPLAYQPILQKKKEKQEQLALVTNQDNRDPPAAGSYFNNPIPTQEKETEIKTETYKASDACKTNIAPSNGKFNSKQYKSDITKLTYTGKTPEPSIDHLERPAPYPKNDVAITEPTQNKNPEKKSYYKDPVDMTPIQLIKFKNKAKFEHMNTKDYENWLGLFKNTPQQLTAFHRSNLRVIIRGGHLTENDLPRVYSLPKKSDHEYTDMMKQGILDNIPQPEYLGFEPSNNETQIGAPSKDNRSLKHLAFINPDEPLKTWILTHYKPGSV